MVKHRQLVPTLGHIAKDQQKNSMASFDFSFPAIDDGTTFVFGSWVCIANGSGGFLKRPLIREDLNVLQTSVPGG